jgi:hypothetical protein
VKLGFRGRIWNIKDLELQRGLRVRKLKKQNTIKFSFKNFFQFKNEVKLGFGGKIQNTKDLEL